MELGKEPTTTLTPSGSRIQVPAGWWPEATLGLSPCGLPAGSSHLGGWIHQSKLAREAPFLVGHLYFCRVLLGRQEPLGPADRSH